MFNELSGEVNLASPIETFGKYLLLEKINAGGMAEVYLSKSIGAEGISRFVAVKRILPQYSENEEFIEMFKEEAKIAVNLNHSNVVAIHEFGVEKKQFYLVMEYVEGQNLRQIVNHLKKAGRPIGIPEIVYVIKEVAAGLDHAHRCLDNSTGRPLNIIHRDMSPQNIMVSFEGEVKIVDFGIAKAESQLEQTRAGVLKGKFSYMSPEQVDGKSLDLRTDIFSVGTILWELLTGERLFTSANEAATVQKIRDGKIPEIRKLNPAVPPELERITLKALAKDRDLRYQKSADFHKDLNRFINTTYPEFSPHEFSVFMKSAFSQMFLENRKKLIAHAKVTYGSLSDNEKTETDTFSMGGSQSGPLTLQSQHQNAPSVIGLIDADSDYDGEKLEVTVSQAPEKINLKSMELSKKTTSPSRISTHMGAPPAAPEDWNKNRQPQIKSKPLPTYRPMAAPTESTNWGALLVILGLFLGGGFYYMQKTDQDSAQKNIAQQNAAQVPMSAESQVNLVEKYYVSIASDPPGARISINGVDTGMMTPSRQRIEAGKDFKLGLSLGGYQYYETLDRASINGKLLHAQLLKLPDTGYVSIDVIGGGSDPVITINNKRIEQKLPITMYGVPANTPLVIKAYNPFTKRTASETITIGTAQKRNLNLKLVDTEKVGSQ